tara:strand:+ start:437 stop:640 length:204 start_codon:yes stop_codon:yes gene_type:complete
VVEEEEVEPQEMEILHLLVHLKEILEEPVVDLDMPQIVKVLLVVVVELVQLEELEHLRITVEQVEQE